MKKAIILITLILVFHILSATENEMTLIFHTEGSILQDNHAHQSKHLNGDSNFSFSPIGDHRTIPAEDKNSQYKWIKYSGKKKINLQTIIKTGHSKATIINREKTKGSIISYNKKIVIYPESRVSINPNGSTHLLTGKIIRFPYNKKRTDRQFYKIIISPRYPAPGNICTIQLITQKKIIDLKLKLEGKYKSPFYKTSNNRYKAIFGLDCMDHRREQPYEINFKTDDGIEIKIKNSILLNHSRYKRKDILRVFKRDNLPYKSKERKMLKKIKNVIFDNPILKEKITLISQDERVIFQKGLEYPTDTKKSHLQISSRKMSYYSRRDEIRKESRIHYKAMRHSSSFLLYRGNFIYPASHRISSTFGQVRRYPGGRVSIHRGIDIASPTATPIKSPNRGRVKFAGKTILCGNNIIIDHGHFIFTKIFHMKKLFVKTGQMVRKGEIIGLVGTSGISTGPHIHWEMWVGSTRIDPNDWVEGFYNLGFSRYAVNQKINQIRDFIYNSMP